MLWIDQARAGEKRALGKKKKKKKKEHTHSLCADRPLQTESAYNSFRYNFSFPAPPTGSRVGSI